MKPWDFWRQSFQAGKPVKEHILAQRLLGFLQRLSDRMKPSIRGRVTSFRWEGRDCGGRISESAQKKNPSWIVCGGNCFFFCGFGFLEDFWNLFWKSHTKVLKPRPKRFGSNLRRWFLQIQRKWRRFTFAQRYRRPRDSPFPHFNGVDFLGRSWSAGRNQRKRKGPKKLCKFWVEFVGCKWSELKPSKMTWRFQIFVKEMHQKPWKCLDDQHWFPKRCAQDWNQRSTSGS